MLFLYLASLAHSMCGAPHPTTSIVQHQVGPKVPILVTTSYRHDELAQRVRLRDPSGKLVDARIEGQGLDVRFVPKRRWTQGVYTVEERGFYADDGHGVQRYATRESDTTAWFAIGRVEVKGGLAPLAPTAVDWDVQLKSAVPVSSVALVVTVEDDQDVDFVGLEIKGIGEISRVFRPRDGRFTLTTLANDEWCNDTFQKYALPEGPFDARIRYYSRDGRVGLGPWQSVTKALDPRIGSRPREPFGWRQVQGPSLTEPTLPVQNSCGKLKLDEPVPVELDTDGLVRLLVDDAGALRLLTKRVEVLYLDGSPLLDLSMVSQVYGDGSRAVVVGSTGDRSPAILVLEDGEQVAVKRFEPGSTLQVESHVPLIVVEAGADGRRLRHFLGPDLGVERESVQVLTPAIVRGGMLNGVPLPHRSVWLADQSDAHALVHWRRSRDEVGVSLYTLEGELVWEEVLPDRFRHGRLTDAGVEVVLGDHRSPLGWGRTLTGDPMQLRQLPTKPDPARPSTMVRSFSFADQRVFVRNGRDVFLANADLGATPAMLVGGKSVVVEDGALWAYGWKDGAVTKAPIGCDPGGLGLPAFYQP